MRSAPALILCLALAGAFLAGDRSARADEKAAAAAEEARSAAQAALEKGDLVRALSLNTQALRIREQLGDRAGTATSLLDLGHVQRSLGAYAKALEHYERGLALAEAIGDRGQLARALAGIAGLHAALGRSEKAAAEYERALALQRELGNRAAVAGTLAGLADVLAEAGDEQKALALLEESLGMFEALGDRRGVAGTLSRLADLYLRRGDAEKAVARAQRAVELQRTLGDRLGAIRTQRTLGRAQLASGRDDEGLRTLEQAARQARAARYALLSTRLLTDLAKARLARAKDPRALALAQQALAELESLLSGLAEEDAAGARQSHGSLYEAGLGAALGADDLPSAFHFTESARAAALTAALAGREARRHATLPGALRTEHAEADAALRQARAEYDTAVRAGKRVPIMKAHRALDAAKDRLAEAAARLEREAARAAGLFYPRPATLAAVRGALSDDEVLVQYALTQRTAVALLLSRSSSRVVPLGDAAALVALAAAHALGDREEDPTGSLAELRAALVTPLDLEREVSTVLVSPAGPLGRLPFGALFERPTALVPSASALLLLREAQSAAAPGEGILALGDPAFARGSRFVPLPATRAEAEGAGTDVLLGTQASESGLRAALGKRKRWKALHLASHALLDTERPLFSAMVLSPDEENDGYLTALEVHRMVIPCELVVLSGSETALGKTYRHEGIVGLTHAFLRAGSPRVIGSLWHVDDEATTAVMLAFYRHWNPGSKSGAPERPPGVEETKPLGAAAALWRAQQHVRTQERWKHPYYWAGWVLWGLP